jgi:hypothetical protein
MRALQKPIRYTAHHFEERTAAPSVRCRNWDDNNISYVNRSPIRYGFCVGRKVIRSLPNLKYQFPRLATPGQKRYKRIPFSCHTCPLPLLWHEFDNCLCNFLQSKVSCCLHMYFLWRHHLPPDKSENDQDIVTLTDLHIVLTYGCWHCFLVFNIWVSHALEIGQ